MRRLSLGALALSAAVWAGEPGDSRRAPAPSLSKKPRAIESERQNTLAEMWQRKVLPPEADRWSPEDMALLLRVRAAEAAGAIDLIKSRLRTLKGYSVVYKPAGSGESRLRLTKVGYDRYLFLRSQEALQYFEAKGVDAKWAFSLRDTDNRRLFEPSGLLTEAGEAVYDRVLAGLETHWKTSSGETLGNRPPRPAPPAAEPKDPPEGKRKW